MSEKPRGKQGVSPWVKFGIPAALIVILAAVLGGVFGSRAANKNDSESDNQQAGNGNSATTAGGVSGGSSGRSSSTGSASSSASATLGANERVVVVENRPAWNWGTNKALGMNLGNWLQLERWMDEDWFVGQTNPNTWDEWTFCQVLGDRAEGVLREHFDTWITEADFDVMVNAGVNMVRIPTGFWAWIPTTGSEPYVNAGQVSYVEKALKWSYDRGLYVVIDLHGLPGSQNGEQHSGHNTTNPAWFGNSANQGRSDELVRVVQDWIVKSPYRSIIAAIEPGNEFRPYTDGQDLELQRFYERSYDTVQSSAWPVPVFIHPGYHASPPMEYWRPFFAARATNPPSLLYSDHPYPGNFPPQTNSADVLRQICTAANRYTGFPAPVVISEYTLYTGIKTQSFERQFYQNQITAYAWSAGAVYWSYRLNPSVEQLRSGLDYSQYSFVTILRNNSDTIVTPADHNLPNTTTEANALAFVAALDTNCGAAPDNASPYQNTLSYSQQASATSSQGNTPYSYTTVVDGTASARVRKRSARAHQWNA